mmetsp:Transcript_12422/g.19942  ORF Transcript_12422/g.19942 Transcript_12422/m.19942 type:complete len:315 (-) Transcript_12422:69-1013(-)
MDAPPGWRMRLVEGVMEEQKFEHAKEMLWHASCSALRRMLSNMDADIKASLGRTFHDSGDTYITAAVKNDDAERVFVLSQHFDVHSTDIEGQTPLHHACIEGNSDLVYFFLKTEFGQKSLNQASRRGFTPLMEAAQKGETGWVALMISRGAKPSVYCNVGQLAAHYAAARGHWDTVTELVWGENVGLQLESADEHWLSIITFYFTLNRRGPHSVEYYKAQEFLTEGVSTLKRHRKRAFERYVDIKLVDSEAFRIVLEYAYPCFSPPTTMDELERAMKAYSELGFTVLADSASNQDSSRKRKRALCVVRLSTSSA